MKKKEQKIKIGLNRYIGKRFNPYFIAELNTSHFGNIDVAKKMIETAKQIGCDCIKLQSWSSNSINSGEYYRKNPITKKLTFNYLYGKNKAELFSILGMPKINLRDGNTKIFIYKNDSCIVHFIMSNTNIESNMIIEHISIQKIKPNCLGSFFNMNNTK